MNAASWTVCLPKTRSDFADDEFRIIALAPPSHKSPFESYVTAAPFLRLSRVAAVCRQAAGQARHCSGTNFAPSV